MNEALLYVLTMVCEMKRERCVPPRWYDYENCDGPSCPEMENTRRHCREQFNDCLKLPSQKKKEAREKCAKGAE